MKKIMLLMLALVFFMGCSTMMLTDPKISWNAPTTNCDGSLASGAITYNVYATQAASFTTVATANESPCGIINLIDTTVHVKLNSTSITTASFDAIVADGTWLFVVEAVNVNGNRSEPSNAVSKIVKGRLAKVVIIVQ